MSDKGSFGLIANRKEIDMLPGIQRCGMGICDPGPARVETSSIAIANPKQCYVQ